MAKYPPYLLHPIGYELFNPGLVTGTYLYCLIIEALGSLRFSASQVTLPHLYSHNFAATGDMEAAARPFVSLDFRHLGFLTPLFSLLNRYR